MLLMFLLGLIIVCCGETESLKFNRNKKIVKLKKSSCCSSTSTRLKMTQIKDLRVIMGGGVKQLRNDIHYFLEIETITGKRYDFFRTGDRKKIKERYYELRTVLGMDVDFEEVEFGRRLRGLDQDEVKERLEGVGGRGWDKKRKILTKNRFKEDAERRSLEKERKKAEVAGKGKKEVRFVDEGSESYADLDGGGDATNRALLETQENETELVRDRRL